MNRDLNESREKDRNLYNLTEVKEAAEERSVSNASKVKQPEPRKVTKSNKP